jgi:alkylhydroperoxidase family enzyme
MLAKFEREWGYDTSYMRTVLDECGVGALMPMNGVQKLSKYRYDVPTDVYYTAVLLATRHGDCGPCLQLGVKMAQKDGVSPETLRAVLAGDREAMSEPVRLSYDFARAVLARDGWDGAAREELRRRYGARAIVSLAYGMAGGGFYPAFKYALGVGHACHRISVGDLEVIPQPL